MSDVCVYVTSLLEVNTNMFHNWITLMLTESIQRANKEHLPKYYYDFKHA